MEYIDGGCPIVYQASRHSRQRSARSRRGGCDNRFTMPIYEYRCSNGHQFEVFQAMSDDPVSVCEQCGAPVERVFHPIAVHFKGSGFYTTDYARKAPATASADGGSDSNSKESNESKESKPDKKPASTSSKKED
jgi:putative FmdB family regulatory protein